MNWRRFSQQAQILREEAEEHIGDGMGLRAAALVAALYLLATAALGIYWSREPALFSVTAATAARLPKGQQPVPGATTTAALVEVILTLLDKSGGFINNDVLPPGIWLDNMPNWELGALAQARDLSHVMRESWGKAAPDAVEDEDLGRVEPRLQFSANSWALPSSESQYREAADYLSAYLHRLQNDGDQRARFVADTANLNRWLGPVSQRLNDLSQRLSACVVARDNPAVPADDMPDMAVTPRGQIDDVFYEARGSAWALVHLLRAVEIDFAEPLRQHNAQVALHQIIRDLEATQQPVYSPVILNGSGFGMLANHSLVMASYMARANASLINLRNSLLSPSSLQDSNQ